jgi:HD superfamily phosphohydrolase
VWGDIEVDGLARAIIDTWAFQRLHYIRQTGMVYKVFPTATTSRFQHSIGSYHTTRVFLRKIYTHQPHVFRAGVPWYLVPIAVLCRNLGYGPLSHVFDRYLSTFSGNDDILTRDWIFHEERTCDILEYIVNDITFPYRLKNSDLLFLKALLRPQKYTHDLLGESHEWIRRIVCDPAGIFDASTIDYLLRDCKTLGLACPFDHFDFNRLLSNCRVIDGRLSFCDRIRDSLVSLVTVKKRLYKEAYHHRKVLEYEKLAVVMFQQFSLTFQENLVAMCRDKDVAAFLDLTDDMVFSQWTRSPVWRSIETRVFPSKTVLLTPVAKASASVDDDDGIGTIPFYNRKRFLRSDTVSTHHTVGNHE